MTDIAATSRPSSLPMTLTIARIIAGPIVAGLVLWAETQAIIDRPLAAMLFVIAGVLFAVAALTDWLDGYLARKLNAVTPLGAALDHSADKVLVTFALVALAYQSLPLNLVIATVIILGRDVFIAGLREGLSASGRALPVSSLGKWKAVAEMAAVTALLFEEAAFLYVAPNEIYVPLAWAGRALLWLAAALALVSAAQYLEAALKKKP